MNFQSYLLLFGIIIHLFLSFIQSSLFPSSLSIQKYYLGKDYENSDVLEVVKLLFFNYGAYHGLVALIAILGQFIESYHLIQGVLVLFISNGITLIVNHPQQKYSLLIGILQAVPALIALFLPSQLDPKHEQSIDLPIIAILIPVIFHIIFFIAESILFSKSSVVRQVFLGKFSKSKEAIQHGTKYFFDQGLYNLKLALLTLYGLFVVKSPSIVIFTMIVYFLAGVVLIYSSPRLWKGFVVQSLPALYVLYLLSDHMEIIYYELLRSIYTEDDEDH